MRWIGILPASIIGMFVGYALVIIQGFFANLFMGGNSNEISITNIITFVGANIITGYAFVYMGTLMAPSYRKATAIVLTVLFAVLTTISIILELGMHGMSKTFWGCAIGFVAAVVSCVQICYKENEEIEIEI